MKSTTKKSVVYKKVKYTRIYFHTPIRYDEVLKTHGKNILTLADYFELKKDRKISKSLKHFLNSWNLYGGIVSRFKIKKSSVECSYLSKRITFYINKNSKHTLYFGNKFSQNDGRTCFISPRGNLYVDAKPNWTTYGFGIILVDKRKTNSMDVFPVKEISFLK